jgi:hypothetical protein
LQLTENVAEHNGTKVLAGIARADRLGTLIRFWLSAPFFV